MIRKVRPDWINTHRDNPFGDTQHYWNNFKQQFQEGDTIEWYDDLNTKSGSAGYQIVRNGEIISRYTEMIS